MRLLLVIVLFFSLGAVSAQKSENKGEGKQISATTDLIQSYGVDVSEDIKSNYSSTEELEKKMSGLLNVEQKLHDEISLLEYKTKQKTITSEEQKLLQTRTEQMLVIKRFHSEVKNLQNELGEQQEKKK